MQPTPFRIVSSLGVAALVGVLVGCSGPESPPARDPSSPEPVSTPQLIYEDITLTEAKPDGGILWRLEARLAEYEPAESADDGADRDSGGEDVVRLGSAHLQSIQGEFFDEDNRAIRTRAERGSVYPSDRRLELTGQVQVESERDNLRLQAEQVEWLPEERLLQAKGQVHIELLDQQGSLRGDRLVIDFGRDQMQLENLDPSQPVQVEYQDPKLVLAATRIIWQMATGEVQALGAVEIDAPEQTLRLRGGQLLTQVPFTEQTELRLLENVIGYAEQTGQEVAAQEIRWRIGSTQLQATGNVRYRQPGQTLTVSGNEALLDWQTNTAQVRGNSQTQFTVP
ncbi:LPS export ABC transporter periplasmic protein LptC [Thermostichus vulcanus]|uniref:LPS export ABC transporter periplasmic protein LptC n=1 Tax=Thermostichus vulcanus str. 'Rupite' TaxID=2813851 RepID=A0ABT0CEJ5_THEVL|nr:LPS export ABC transporter periplasmic protein LptC [Thermostichus vulcanus]MCJ2544204.1 LPS export ABC transporter periplasmic protein LptC [Thermostichus vulcanus str. 'Rupite']